MKLIKKIAAIMLSVMMVLGMASVVSADGTESGTPAANTGTITINNAIAGQTYKIYKILELESYDETTRNYAYKATPDWKTFIESSTDYFKTDSNGGVTWNAASGETEDQKATKAAEFAKLALARANKLNDTITPIQTETANSSETPQKIEFSNLSLGYYLVDSSAGALCSLNTTAKNVTIQEKNGVPSVEKKVQEDSKEKEVNTWFDSNTADIGQTVNFQTTIKAQPGAQNYVLHDKMSDGLTFSSIESVQTQNGNDVAAAKYTIKKSTDSPASITDGCTFEIAFDQSFCDTLGANDQIIVTYSATLNEKAVIAGEGNKNETWLKYGDNSETTHDTTTTKTYSIPIFKYTTKDSKETGLEGAKFTLSKNEKGTNLIELVSVSNDDKNGDTYRVAKENEATGITKITEVTTKKSGKFTIKGLDADTYYLTETKQPDGYNKLSAPIKIVISEEGKITVNDVALTGTEVKVQNNTGTILPSTGGNGTSLIYFLGAVLALVSGVVLITKQRMKNN